MRYVCIHHHVWFFTVLLQTRVSSLTCRVRDGHTRIALLSTVEAGVMDDLLGADEPSAGDEPVSGGRQDGRKDGDGPDTFRGTGRQDGRPPAGETEQQNMNRE